MNSLDNFYLILPSNVNPNELPQNKQSDYTTIFKEPILLSGKYEVALTEMNYSPNIKASFGTINFVLKKFNDQPGEYPRHPFLFNLDIFVNNGLTLKSFCDYVNNEIKQTFQQAEFRYRHRMAWNNNNIAKKAGVHSLYYDQHPNAKIEIIKKSNTFEILDLEETSRRSSY